MRYGADIDELDDLALHLDRSADEISDLLQASVGSVALAGLGTSLTTIWKGPRASDFTALWSTRHLLQLRGLESMLRQAANTARDNANEQRRASDGATGAGSVKPPTHSADVLPDSELFGPAEDFLEALGLADDVHDRLFDLLRQLDPELFDAFGRLVGDNPFLTELFTSLDFLGDVIDVADVVVTFVADVVQQLEAGLPIDEILVHAVGETAATFAVGELAGRAAHWATTAIAAALSGGSLTVVGHAVGWVIGEGIDIAATQIFEHLDGGERAGDLLVEAYRGWQDLSSVVVEGVEYLVDGSGQIIDGVIDTGGQIIDGVVDVGGDVIDGVMDVGGNVIDTVDSALSLVFGQ